MKLGFVSAILDGWTFEEMIDTASEMGFSCVEVACWPQGKAERRYAGVSHIDTDNLSDEKAAYILNYCKARKVEISSLAYYPNTLDGNLEKRASVVAHLKNVIRASHKLGVNMVTRRSSAATRRNPSSRIWSSSRKSGRRSSRWPRNWASKSPSKTAPCSSARINGRADRT